MSIFNLEIRNQKKVEPESDETKSWKNGELESCWCGVGIQEGVWFEGIIVNQNPRALDKTDQLVFGKITEEGYELYILSNNSPFLGFESKDGINQTRMFGILGFTPFGESSFILNPGDETKQIITQERIEKTKVCLNYRFLEEYELIKKSLLGETRKIKKVS